MAALLRGINVENVCSLKRQGLTISQISEITGFDRKTIRKYLQVPDIPVYGPRAPRPSILDPFKSFIDKKLEAGVWNVAVLFGLLKKDGYKGGYTSLKVYVRPRRDDAGVVAVRRFETEPGHQAQVDWGDLGEVVSSDGTKQSISAFALTLGHSRGMFSDVSTDQKLPTLLRMHERAFSELGGVPQEILYDQMKTVVIRTLTIGADERGEIRWNPTFLDFARYWGFTPRLCRAYRPQTKGKIEAGIKYIRRNFLCGRKADSLEDLSCQLHVWLNEVANARVHGTTHRVVREAMHEEQQYLQPVGTRPPYPIEQDEIRRVSRDAYVAFRANLYAAPWQIAGKEVSVRLSGEQLQIRRDNKTLATYPLCTGKHQRIEDQTLHAGMPFSDGRSRGKTMITIEHAAPVVEQRSLDVYDEAAGCSIDERAA